MYGTNIELVRPFLIRFQSYLEDICQIIPLESPYVVLRDSSDNFYFYNYLTPASGSPSAAFNLLTERKKLQIEIRRPHQGTEITTETIQHIEYLTMNHYLLKLSERDICITEFGTSTGKAKPMFLPNTRSAKMVKRLTDNLIFFILPGFNDKDASFICRWQTQKYKKLRWLSADPPRLVEYVNPNKLVLLTLNSTVIIYDLTNFGASRVIIPQENSLIRKLLVSNLEGSKIHCFSPSFDQYTCYDAKGNCIRTASVAVDENEEVYRVELIGDSQFLFWSSSLLKIYGYSKNRFELAKQLTSNQVLALSISSLVGLDAKFDKIKVIEDRTILGIIRIYPIKNDSIELENTLHQDIFIALDASELIPGLSSKEKTALSVSSLSKNQVRCLENSKKQQIVAMDTFDNSLLCAVTSDSYFLLYELKHYQLLKQKQLAFEKVISIRFISNQRLIVQHQTMTQQTNYDIVLLPNLRSSPLFTAYLCKKGWRFSDVSLFLGNEQIVAGITKGTLILNNTLPNLPEETDIREPQKKLDTSSEHRIEGTKDSKDIGDDNRNLKESNEMNEEGDGHRPAEKRTSKKSSKPSINFIGGTPLVSFNFEGSKGIKSKIHPKYDSLDFAKIFALHADGIISTKQKNEPNKSRVFNLVANKDLFEITFNYEIQDMAGLESGSMAAASMGDDGQIATITIFDWEKGSLYIAIDCINSPFLIGNLQNHLVWADENEADPALLDIKAVNLSNCKSLDQPTSLKQKLNSVFLRGTTLLEGVLFKKEAICFTRGKKKMFLQEEIASPESICVLDVTSIQIEFFKTLLVANRKFEYSVETLKEIQSFIFPK